MDISHSFPNNSLLSRIYCSLQSQRSPLRISEHRSGKKIQWSTLRGRRRIYCFRGTHRSAGGPENRPFRYFCYCFRTGYKLRALVGQAAVFSFVRLLFNADVYRLSGLTKTLSLGRKIGWIRRHGSLSFRLGFLPAAVSMIPILNMFFIALLFPLLTVHATLNFYKIESGSHHAATAYPARKE